MYCLVVPKDNLLRKINELIDFTFIYEELTGKYCLNNGRTAESPVRMFKFTIAELLFSGGNGLTISNWQNAVILSLDSEVSQVPDALHLPAGYLGQALKGKYKFIKTVLQEGKVVQGIGNAYVDEILYAAKLSPFPVAAKIPEKKISDGRCSPDNVLLEKCRCHSAGTNMLFRNLYPQLRKLQRHRLDSWNCY